MTPRKSHIAIPGSEFVPLPGAKRVGPADPNGQIIVTLVLRPRVSARPLHDDQTLADRLPGHRSYLSREEFESNHGAHADDLALVEHFARAHSFKVLESSPSRHSVVLQGHARDFCKAFHVEMFRYEHERGKHRGIKGPIHIPRTLAGTVRAVLGLHDRPVARRHVPLHTEHAHEGALSSRDIAEIYRFPRHATGTGQCIGVIELGGGYHRSDLQSFFSSLKIPAPRITDVSVHGAKNAPADRASLAKFMKALEGGQKSADKIKKIMAGKSARSRRAAELLQSTVETTMDVELVGAFAPGARIVVYFAPNSEQGIYHALTTALADRRHRPSVLSLSWGEPESSVSPNYAALIDDVLKNLAHVGVTVCVSSGDFGAHNGSASGEPSVNFPASSPYALGCGGTMLQVAGNEIEAEVAWSCEFDGMQGASGGGISSLFERPYWQNDFDMPAAAPKRGASKNKNSKRFEGPVRGTVKGRGVPDVAGVADPHTGCRILVGGVAGVASGTSAVAPLWAALIARLNEAIGASSGYLNSLLYKLARESGEHSPFRPIMLGENGAYQAGPGWNACTGLGSPVGDRLLAALEGRPH